MAADLASRTADTTPLLCLGEQERAVLSALVANRGRVLGREELSRLAGLSELSERRCDSVLVGIRRALGADAIVTVRRRGWMLTEPAIRAALQLLEPA
jgi:DNA-binding winged helix-turn-helix (wHTH) protein